MDLRRGFSLEKAYTIILISIAVLFFTMLTWRAFSQVLIGHEMASLEFAGHNVSSNTMVEGNGWLYYTLILRPFTAVFGVSPLAARMPSVISGVVSLFLTAFLACKLAGKRAALLSGLLFVIHPGIYEFSTHCRFYAFNAMMCLVSTCLLFFITEKDGESDNSKLFNKTICKIFYLLSACVCVLSQTSSIFIFPVHWLILFLKASDKKRALGFIGLSGAVLGVILYILHLYDPLASWRLGDYPDITFQYVTTVFSVLIGTGGGMHNYSGFMYTPLTLSLVPCFCFIWGGYKVFGAFINKQKVSEPSVKYLGLTLLLIAFAPMCCLLVISLFWVNIFDDPTLYYSISPICIIMGLGLEKTPKYLGLIMLLIWGLSIPAFRSSDPKHQIMSNENDWQVDKVVEFFESPSPLELQGEKDSHMRSDASDGRIFTNNSSYPIENGNFPYAQARVWFYGPEKTFVQTWIIDEP